MLKRHNKLITLLILAFFMFSIVGAAGAAQFSDVTGTDVDAKAIYKLTALGILEGYPDGTFAPEATITRAEFAKIAVYMAGLERVAAGMQGASTTFSDVDASHWASGWINVAQGQGLVNGYPDGTYRPQAQITQAEALSVLMRNLGYNENLTGSWPSNYVSKAASLGVLDDITFISNKAATRGEVAIISAETLNQNMVEYKADSNTFGFISDPNQNSISLIEDKFDALIVEDALVTDFTVIDGVYELEYALFTNNGVIYDTVELLEDIVLVGAPSELQLNENFIEFMVDSDGDAFFAAVSGYETVTSTNKFEITDAQNRIKVEDKTYSFLRNFDQVQFNGVFEDLENGQKKVYEDQYDAIKLVLNDDGRVAFIKGWNFPIAGIVDEVIGERINIKENADLQAVPNTPFNTTVNFKDRDYFVQKDGIPANLSDIEENDAVWVLKNFRGTDYYIIASGTKFQGNLDSISMGLPILDSNNDPIVDGSGVPEDYAVKSVKVNGIDFQLAGIVLPGQPIAAAGGSYLSTDGGKDFENLNFNVTTENTFDNDYDLFGENVQLVLSPFGKVVAIISDVDSSDSNIYGVVTDLPSETTLDKGERVKLVTILLGDDEEYTYSVTKDTEVNGQDNRISTPSSGVQGINPGELVAIKLDSDGLVDTIETQALENGTQTANAATINDDRKTVFVDDRWRVTTDAVIFNCYTVGGNDEFEVVNWSEFKNAALNSGINMTYAYYDGVDLKYLVVNNGASGALTTDSDYAMVASTGRDGDGRFANLLIDGESVKYYIDSNASVAAKGRVIEFRLVGGELAITDAFNPYTTTAGDRDEIDRTRFSSDIIEIGGVSYLLSEDVLAYDLTDTDNPAEMMLSELVRNDYVWFLQDTDNEIIVIVKLDQVTDDEIIITPGTLALELTGANEVTVTNAVYNAENNNFRLKITNDVDSTVQYIAQTLAAQGDNLVFGGIDISPGPAIFTLELYQGLPVRENLILTEKLFLE